jgi:hypothetical protein
MQAITFLRALLFALAIWAPIGIIGADAQPQYRSADVCSVLARPRHFRSSHIKIDAQVFSDGMHGTILIDGKCPKGGLPLDYPLPNAGKSVDDLDHVIRSAGAPGTTGRRVTGSFIGRLRVDRATGRISFALLSVSDLKSEEVPK